MEKIKEATIVKTSYEKLQPICGSFKYADDACNSKYLSHIRLFTDERDTHHHLVDGAS